jgi:hypothetical protein
MMQRCIDHRQTQSLLCIHPALAHAQAADADGVLHTSVPPVSLQILAMKEVLDQVQCPRGL